MRKNLYEKYPDCFINPRPKTHYLSHYPAAYEKYGPPVATWTARYEAKHRIAKSLAHSAKNYVNISKTLAERQQKRHASILFNGLYSVEEVELPAKLKRKRDFDARDFSTETEIVDFMNETSVLCESITFSGQIYKTNDVIVLEASSRISLKVGLIQGIIFKDTSVYFICHIYDAIRNENFQYFETQTFDNRLYFILGENLADYRPLISHGTVMKFTFPLHHYISIKM